MQESTVTIKGQTTLPKDVRAALRLSPGDRVRYMILDGGEVRLVRSGPVSRLAGVLKGRVDRAVSLEDMDEAIAQGALDQGRAGR
jgi:antitoxin PrlF